MKSHLYSLHPLLDDIHVQPGKTWLPSFLSSCGCFYSLRRERKTSRDRALVPHYFLFYYPRMSRACFDCSLRCSHKTNLACSFASIDSSFKLNLRAGC